MVDKTKVVRDSKAKLGRADNSKMQIGVKGNECQVREITKIAEQEASQIIAQAYKEASKIITEAKRKVNDTVIDVNMENTTTYGRLSQLLKSSKLSRDSYDCIDNLFVQIRYHLTKLPGTRHTTTDELGELINQLDYWVESLVSDSLRLASLSQWLQRTTDIAKELRQKLDT